MQRLIGEQYLKCSWYGSKQMTRYLKRQRYCFGNGTVSAAALSWQRYCVGSGTVSAENASPGSMQLRGLVAIFPGPQTSRRHPKHPMLRHLLRNLSVIRANQAWCTDVIYILMAHGFIYLVAIMDWHTLHFLSRRLSTIQNSGFCLEALKRPSKNMAPRIPATLIKAISSRVQSGSMN